VPFDPFQGVAIPKKDYLPGVLRKLFYLIFGLYLKTFAIFDLRNWSREGIASDREQTGRASTCLFPIIAKTLRVSI
jgi:hypothetical protein